MSVQQHQITALSAALVLGVSVMPALTNEAPQDQNPLKVLVVASSFGQSAQKYLEPMAEHEGFKLHMIKAYIGACTLQRHWECIQAAEADPDYVSHATNSDKVRKPNGWTASLPELVSSEPWDIIVTQQSARGSGKPSAKDWQPYADLLLAYFRTNAPGAEIVLQQTWSFNEPASEPCGGQEKQFANIEANYRKLAEQHKLRVIPTGAAVQLARQGVVYRFPTKEELAALKHPDLPPPTGDVTGGYSWSWKKDETTNEHKFIADDIHMNQRGQYLQSCCWFGIFFGRDPASITYVPAGFDPGDAAFLRACASQAISEHKQAAR